MVCQKYIFKIRSTRLRRNRWNLTLPLDEARRNEEIISLADSQVLRWIDELNGITDADERARNIKRTIRSLRKLESSPETKREIRKKYAELDLIQFKPDYMCLIIDKASDYRRACKGFSINGIRYKRLLGTNGGIKNSTIVFISERLWPEINRRVENDRDQSVPFVTAKLEAYKALTCSASIPVSLPNGILVVDDAKTSFLDSIVYLDDECEGEPLVEERHNEHIDLDATDGFGLMLPSLAERWSEEVGLGYTAGGFNTRFSFEKGMLFAFDFIEFAEKVGGTYLVKDAWGNEVDVRNIEAIFTVSMIKLWDSYTSCDDYISKSVANGYMFGVTKAAPETLEDIRTSNYQFLQVIDMNDDDIEELIAPTLDEFHAVLHGDWRSTVLFLKGESLDAQKAFDLDDDYIKALMIDRRILEDPFVQGSVYQLIRNRINMAKIGVLRMHANYSILSGDPYLLCQSIWGLEKTGLLRAGELYNQYWADTDAEQLACFRAPMSTQENVRRMIPSRTEECRHWFQYIRTCTILNAWDMTTAALNGADYDGDLTFLTDNPVILRRLEDLPPLVCAQRKAEKRISTEDDFIKSNIDSFGNEIGQTTNYITSMYEVRSQFEKDSEEYKTLSYRIKCGQTYQQNAIDKAKGIVCKPMPRNWHDRFAAARIEDEHNRDLYIRIAAHKKPYFMRYIYPDLMREYNTYIKKADKNCLREFGMTVSELEAIPDGDRTDAQNEWLWYYHDRIPVGTNDCVMNRICRRFEREFDGYVGRAASSSTFDYTIMRSDAEYTDMQMRAVRNLYREFNESVRKYKIESEYSHIDLDDDVTVYNTIVDTFRTGCHIACPNDKSLCNVVLDLCYSRASTKAFAWKMCGAEIIRNLLESNGNKIKIPIPSDSGDYMYCGKLHEVITVDYSEEGFDDIYTE